MIHDYGWSDMLQQQLHAYGDSSLLPGRVIVQQRGQYRVATERGECIAGISGRFAYTAQDGDYPVTGDWVLMDADAPQSTGRIQAVMPRRTAFVRKAAGLENRSQVVAANVDIALLAASLNGDLNLRRLERYLVLSRESGARAVIVLTKADLIPEPQQAMEEVAAIAGDVPIIAVSAVDGSGLDKLRDAVLPGQTAALLGSSGVGKSSLINALAGRSVLLTGEIRESDDKGRHTTTHRELIRLDDGRLFLDTPGMRELGLWAGHEGVASLFGDIEDLASSCRFRNCRHVSEPGCAVRFALEDGSLDRGRWQSFEKLQRELAHAKRQEDPLARAAHRKQWIGRHKAHRALVRHRERQED